jgi:uncharacterized membrane protein
VTIGIIWINHHHNMRTIDRADRTFMFINLLLLLDVAFIPSRPSWSPSTSNAAASARR